MTEEIWKPIPDYVGYYEASSIGRIKSLSRKHRKERIMKIHKTDEGYMQVGLTKDGHYRGFKVHTLVARAFFGMSKLKTNHINSDKADNRIENLEYVSNRENVNHSKMKNRNLPTGVSRNHKRFSAQASINGKSVYCGCHDTPEEAHQAYLRAVAGEDKYASGIASLDAVLTEGE